MTTTIREKADAIGTLRHVSVFLMETLARWVPSTPELEAKVLFGRHVWEFAQHADALGKRTAELRAALHHSPPPSPAYVALLEELAQVVATPQRIERFYEGMLPELAARYHAYLADTDRLLDEPSVRIIERVLPDLSRMRDEAASSVRETPALAGTSDATRAAWGARIGAIDSWVVHRPAAGTAARGLS